MGNSKCKEWFFSREHKQIYVVDYFHKYVLVVEWYTVRIMLTLGINQVWDTNKIYFWNELLKEKLKLVTYLNLSEVLGLDKLGTRRDLIMKLNFLFKYGAVTTILFGFNLSSLCRRYLNPSGLDSWIFFGRGMNILVYIYGFLLFN